MGCRVGDIRRGASGTGSADSGARTPRPPRSGSRAERPPPPPRRPAPRQPSVHPGGRRRPAVPQRRPHRVGAGPRRRQLRRSRTRTGRNAPAAPAASDRNPGMQCGELPVQSRQALPGGRVPAPLPSINCLCHGNPASRPGFPDRRPRPRAMRPCRSAGKTAPRITWQPDSTGIPCKSGPHPRKTSPLAIPPGPPYGGAISEPQPYGG